MQPNELDEKYKTLPNDDFIDLVRETYKNLNNDDYVKKMVELYKLYPMDNFIESINNIYVKLPNVVTVNNKKYKLNSLLSKLTQDTKIFINKSTGPSANDLRNDLLGVRDQGILGISACYAGATMKEFLEVKEKLFTTYLAPASIYALRENKKSIFITPKNVLDLLKLKGYAYVNSINDLKMAINQNGPCMIQFPCYNGGRFFWKKSSENESLLGAQCVVAVGYDATRGFLIRNSWGENWGEFGYTWFPYEDWGLQNEVWTCINSLVINKIDNAPVLPIKPFKKEDKILTSIDPENFKELVNNYFTESNICILTLIIIFIIIIMKIKSK
jgi:hypothetical protein